MSWRRLEPLSTETKIRQFIESNYNIKVDRGTMVLFMNEVMQTAQMTTLTPLELYEHDDFLEELLRREPDILTMHVLEKLQAAKSVTCTVPKAPNAQSIAHAAL